MPALRIRQLRGKDFLVLEQTALSPYSASIDSVFIRHIILPQFLFEDLYYHRDSSMWVSERSKTREREIEFVESGVQRVWWRNQAIQYPEHNFE